MAATLTTIEKQQAEKQQFMDEVHDVLNNHLNDYKKLKKGIKRLHRIYVLQEVKNNELGESNADAEQMAYRRAMEDSIEHMRISLKKGKQIHADAY
jgi:hypothetical protein